MSIVTHFYTGSTESEVEKQMADLRDIHSAYEFVEYLESVIKGKFTDDYFEYTLPNDMITSSASAPSWSAYLAAINVLGTPMLFSSVPASKFMILGSNGTKNSIEKHHIFPKHYLETIGVGNDRDRNVAEYRAKMGEENYLKTCTENALPPEFEKLDYFTFIEKRRKLMAKIIKKGYEKL